MIEDSQPNTKLFSQNTTIVRKSDHTEFSGGLFPPHIKSQPSSAAAAMNPSHQLQIKGKEMELQIICDAIQRDHDDSLQELETNNQFLIECAEQDI